MNDCSDSYVAQVLDFINQRPRKILTGLTPYEIHLGQPRSPTVRS
jgi:IS30 family transposase